MSLPELDLDDDNDDDNDDDDDDVSVCNARCFIWTNVPGYPIHIAGSQITLAYCQCQCRYEVHAEPALKGRLQPRATSLISVEVQPR